MQSRIPKITLTFEFDAQEKNCVIYGQHEKISDKTPYVKEETLCRSIKIIYWPAEEDPVVYSLEFNDEQEIKKFEDYLAKGNLIDASNALDTVYVFDDEDAIKYSRRNRSKEDFLKYGSSSLFKQVLQGFLTRHVSWLSQIETSVDEEKSQKISIDDLQCPITHEIFYNPRTASCGHSFEKDEINKWIHRHRFGEAACPCCRKPITADSLKKNPTLKENVRKYLEEHPENVMDQYFPRKIIDLIISDDSSDIAKILHFLDKYPGKINQYLVGGKNLLHLAILQGKIPLIKKLLSRRDIDINARIQSDSGLPWEIGKAALHFAITYFSRGLFEKLLSVQNLDVNIRDNQGKTPLYLAAEKGDIGKVRALLRMPGIDIISECTLDDRKSAYEIAKDRGNKDIVDVFNEPTQKFLFAKNYLERNEIEKAAYYLRSIYFDNLSHANSKAHSKALIDFLNHVKSIIKETHQYESLCRRVLSDVLEEAIYKNAIELIFFLIKEVPDQLNECFCEGYSILHRAVISGKSDLVTALLEYEGIDVNVVDKTYRGGTPLHLSVTTRNITLSKLLLAYGAKVNVTDKSGYTPLMHACGQFFYETAAEVVELLINYGAGANVNRIGFSGRTALHNAVEYYDIETVKLITAVESCDVNIKDDRGESPLFIAAKIGEYSKVLALLQNPSIDVDAFRLPGDGKSASDLAKANGHMDVWKLFCIYRMIAHILNDNIPKVDLEFFIQSSDDGLADILNIFESKYSPQALRRAEYLINQIRGLVRENRMQIDLDSSLDRQKIRDLNQLFILVKNSNIKNKYDLLGIIRREGFESFEKSLEGEEGSTKRNQLSWIRDQPFIAQHRSSFWKMGRTKTQVQIDKILHLKYGVKI